MALGLAIIDGAAANHIPDRPKVANQIQLEFRQKLPKRPDLQPARVRRPVVVWAEQCTADVVNDENLF